MVIYFGIALLAVGIVAIVFVFKWWWHLLTSPYQEATKPNARWYGQIVHKTTASLIVLIFVYVVYDLISWLLLLLFAS